MIDPVAHAQALEQARRANERVAAILKVADEHERMVKRLQKMHAEALEGYRVETSKARRERDRAVAQRIIAVKMAEETKETLESFMAKITADEILKAMAHDLSEARAALQRLEDDRRTLADVAQEAEAERNSAMRARRGAEARLAEYERRAQASGGHSGSRGLLDGSTMTGIVEQAKRVCPLVIFTLDSGPLAALDRDSSAGPMRNKLADTLATMQDYAEAKSLARATGGAAGPTLANLLTYTRAGHGYLSAQKLALKESDQVMTDRTYAAARLFAVPDDVDAAGRVPMCAHVRIGSGKPPAARLHYYDDTDNTGLIIVGYIGEHLPNPSRN
ncbi:hypothetical protein [Streptomyces triticiradicis]|uniref:Uncharacterized protein n=1 Tax=Streptomyces triticiradicis TaxID=2651189 RepID=A0A7J5D9J3_9ACTN|nr:hypothetical protein [Streptomyces triticiradicis]KAB1984615.1 hypothetical protein F8144_28245 [Streptomyces triticiradicis]